MLYMTVSRRKPRTLEERPQPFHQRVRVLLGDPVSRPRYPELADIFSHLAHHFTHQRASRADRAADRKHRDRELSSSLECRAVVFGIAIEGPVKLEAGTHGARRRIGRRVAIKLGIIDRRRIEEARLEECLQILTFAT